MLERKKRVRACARVYGCRSGLDEGADGPEGGVDSGEKFDDGGKQTDVARTCCVSCFSIMDVNRHKCYE